MGNNVSGGSISLVVHPPNDPLHPGYYVAGKKVCGTVYVQSNTDNLPSDTRLEVYLTGKEDVKVRYQTSESYRGSDGEMQTRTVTRYAYSKRDIVRITVPIASNPANNYAGKYEYPFEIELPHHLPTSMDHHGYGEYCRIIYKIKHQVHGSWFGNNGSEYEIPVMMAPMPVAPVPYNLQPLTEKVKFCCCFDSGSIVFGVSINDTRLARNDRVNISFACFNESTAEIEYVSANIIEKVAWSARGHSSTSTKILVAQAFQRTERMDKLRKSELKRRRDSDSSNASHQEKLARNRLREVFDAIKTSENMVTLFIPQTAKHTYRGQCCKIEHNLRIQIKTAFGMSNPTIRIPIQIGAASEGPQMDMPVPTAPPSQWNITEPEPDVQVSAPPLPAPSAPPLDWGESDVVVVPATVVPSSNEVYIGEVVATEGDETDQPVIPVVPVVPLPGITPNNEPSLKGLIDELRVSVSASSVVKRRVDDEMWKSQLFSTLTPQQFVKIIRATSIEFDQAEVAEAIAPAVDQFTCQHVVATIRAVSDWMRLTMINRLLSHTVDLAAHSETILSELTEWEKLSTEREFELCLLQNQS